MPAVNRSDQLARAIGPMTAILRPTITTDPLPRLARATTMSQPYRSQRTSPQHGNACSVSQSALGYYNSIVQPCGTACVRLLFSASLHRSRSSPL